MRVDKNACFFFEKKYLNMLSTMPHVSPEEFTECHFVFSRDSTASLQEKKRNNQYRSIYQRP